MSDLIKREDAIKAVAEVLSLNRFASFRNIKDFGRFAERMLRNVPSADRPQGEWIDMGDFEQCSACKGTRLKEFQSYYGKVTWIKTPYCPNCGARMKGADDERDS